MPADLSWRNCAERSRGANPAAKYRWRAKAQPTRYAIEASIGAETGDV